MKKSSSSQWLGKLSGHVAAGRAQFDAQNKDRAVLEKSPNTLLSEREIRGEWDASRVLMTTLGGANRPITADDLAAFRHNMRVAQRQFKGGGITARQVLDLAHAKALHYAGFSTRTKSDLDKAKREIHSAIIASAHNDTLRFITNAGPDYGRERHYVIIKLHGFNEAAAKIAALPQDAKPAQIRQVANWLRKQKLSFDCDCGRHQYFFRYVATIGGFATGRKETAYPKIRNPELRGVACKHVLRTMAELESSGAVLAFLERHLSKISEYKSSTQNTQKDADAAAQKSSTRIKSSAQRKMEATRKREKSALARAAIAAQPSQKSPNESLGLVVAAPKPKARRTASASRKMDIEKILQDFQTKGGSLDEFIQIALKMKGKT